MILRIALAFHWHFLLVGKVWRVSRLGGFWIGFRWSDLFPWQVFPYHWKDELQAKPS